MGGGNSPKTANSSLKDGWWQTSSKNKQGGFIGGELGFSDGWIGVNSNADIISADTTFVPHINMIGGYQWYFLDKPWLHLGLRLKGYLGYSNYSVDNSHHLSNITSYAIHTGIEVGAIYDFVQYKEHTLGVYIAPIGFELSALFGNVTIKNNDTIINKTFSLTPYVTFTYKYSMGLHYYYNVNHMVFLGYQINWSYGGSKDKYNGNRSLDNLKSMGFQAHHFHSFMIGYAYKF